MKRATCPIHGMMPATYQLGSPLTLGISTGFLVLHLSKNPLAAFLSGLAGAMAGAELARYCPQCGARLVQVVDDLDTFAG
jgi:hypothetical protein